MSDAIQVGERPQPADPNAVGNDYYRGFHLVVPRHRAPRSPYSNHHHHHHNPHNPHHHHHHNYSPHGYHNGAPHHDVGPHQSYPQRVPPPEYRGSRRPPSANGYPPSQGPYSSFAPPHQDRPARRPQSAYEYGDGYHGEPHYVQEAPYVATDFPPPQHSRPQPPPQAPPPQLSTQRVLRFHGEVREVRGDRDAVAAVQRIRAIGHKWLGLDTESRPQFPDSPYAPDPPCLLQIATSDCVYLFFLRTFVSYGVQALCDLLYDATILKCGSDIHGDIRGLAMLFPPFAEARGLVDSLELGKIAGIHRPGLKGLVSTWLGLNLSKPSHIASCDWDYACRVGLSPQQAEYAVHDAYAGYLLLEYMVSHHLVDGVTGRVCL